MHCTTVLLHFALYSVLNCFCELIAQWEKGRVAILAFDWYFAPYRHNSLDQLGCSSSRDVVLRRSASVYTELKCCVSVPTLIVSIHTEM